VAGNGAALTLRANGQVDSMAFHEDVVLPTSHSQKNAPYQSHVVPMLGIDCYFGRSPERDLIVGNILFDIDYGQCGTAARSSSQLHTPGS